MSVDLLRTDADPEAALVSRLCEGDDAAFRELYRAHAGDVYRLARRFVYSDAEAEEAVQEVFIAAFRYVDRFRGQCRLRTWLYRITVNRALKRRRWWTRRREVSDSALMVEADRAVRPDRLAQDRATLAQLRGLLNQLESRKRAVIVLHELEGLDTQEIADILECPRSTVLTRLSRARAELIALAARAGFGPEAHHD